MRSPELIRGEIEELSGRRSACWRARTEGKATRAEVEALERGIEALWLELREASALVRNGPRDEILARARVEERIDHDLRRRYGPGRDVPARDRRRARSGAIRA